MSSASSKLVAFIGIVAVLVLGLVVIVRLTPPRHAEPSKSLLDFSDRPTSSYQVLSTSPEQMQCEKAGGKWTECGRNCQRQCLCGGATHWTCPTDQVCTDWQPSQADPLAIGICRLASSVTSTAIEATTTVSTSSSTKPNLIRPKPADAFKCDPQNFICVNTKLGATVTDPIIATGTAIAFENTINWELLGPDQAVLDQGTIITNAGDAGLAGSFSIKAFFQPNQFLGGKQGTLNVFSVSPKDGSKEQIVSQSFTFEKTTMPVKFFYATSMNQDSATCTDVKSVATTIMKSPTPIETTLHDFFLTDSSSFPGGFAPAKPDEARLESVKLDQGTLTVTLTSGSFAHVAGSCSVQAIRAEIEAVAKQFSAVKDVVIIEQGKTAETTLQP